MRIDSYRPNARVSYDPATKAIVSCYETELGGIHYDLYDYQGSVFVVRRLGERTFINKYNSHGCSGVTGPAAEQLAVALAKQFPVSRSTEPEPAPPLELKAADRKAKPPKSEEPEPPRAA
ncbi:MAG TPA: hypothetical protein VGG39_23425 [Polyangiaceae bacterium]|jgi:hypothetical protein